MKVERMVACTPNKRAIIPREFTIRTTTIKSHPADPTCFILSIPCPRSDSMPLYLNPSRLFKKRSNWVKGKPFLELS
uniref:Anaphase-promoting complex subunit 11 n=1 Tax=Rhizophora mucronata TaxID=61149 RepID=A0A2P2KIL8_RHIMU